MSVRIAGSVIYVEGIGAVGDAEPILAALQEDRTRTIDLRGAARLHSAIIQLLLAVRPAVVGTPADPSYVAYIVPVLDAGDDRHSAIDKPM